MPQKTIFQEYVPYIVVCIIFLSFAIPLTLLYYFHANSFNETWKGRTFYLFFIWLFALEVILNWEKYSNGTAIRIHSRLRSLIFVIFLFLPTIYVTISNFFGLNEVILDFSRQFNVEWINWMPLSIEYLVFAALFAGTILLAYGFGGLSDFSLSTALLGAIGTIYMIDNVYPYGAFTPFQIFVPTTAMLASNVLNFMGYQTRLIIRSSMPLLQVWNSEGAAQFLIAWPCSGIQSLLIYTLTILLFLKKTAISWVQRGVYFLVGAVVTYFINALRIVSIFVIAANGGDYSLFHNYYGELYSMAWIISYPLVIIGSRMFWVKIRLKLNAGNLVRKLFYRSPNGQDSQELEQAT